tara:strand:+ start:1813 stop:3147 length:1335 start_codon:yes stop_codon:yes gene_type:complete
MRELRRLYLNKNINIRNKKCNEVKDSRKEDAKNRINVYDAIMGSGKTTAANMRMKSYIQNNQKFIYVTPFLKEIQRTKSSLGNDNIFAPKPTNEYVHTEIILDENGNINFNKLSRNKYKFLNKGEHFLKLVKDGKNIVTTHALFTALVASNAGLFNDYLLIIDEVINPIEVLNFGPRDLEILTNEKLIAVDSNNKVISTDKKYKDDSFKTVLAFCKQDNVYLQNNSFISLFPIEIIKAFKEVQILTYLFESSLMAAYLKLSNINYNIIKNNSEPKEKELIKNNLTIYEGSRNQSPRSKDTNYSKSHLTKLSSKQNKSIKNAVTYVFRYEFGSKPNEKAFTTFKIMREKLQARGYIKGFIPVNSRATNEFVNINAMAYLANRYLNPAIVNFFKSKGVIIDEDTWALSELIQWVWRGSIRDKKPMNLYIPSNRMRRLLYQWLDNEL